MSKCFFMIRSFVCFTIIRHILCYEECSDHKICPGNKPFCSEAGCVFECLPPFFTNGTYCVATCGDWFVKNQLCLRQCPDKWFIRETLELIGGRPYMKRSCTPSCDFTEYIYGNFCFKACPLKYNFITNRVCSSQCVNEKDFVSNFSINSITYHTCLGQCPYLSDGVFCTDKCTVSKLVLNSTCVDKCPEPYPFISRNRCVQNCPETTVHIEDNACLENCTEQKPYFMNETCTDICPENYYITSRNGVVFCEYQCRNGEYVHKNTCLDSCADDGKRNYFLYYLNQTCVDECPHGYFYKRETDYLVGTCVASCSNDEFIYNNSCVKSCSEGTFLFNNTCITECPVNFPFTCLVGQDGQCNGAGSIPYTLSQASCVSMCPQHTLIFNNSCVSKCPKSYFVFEKICVLECPKHSPILQNGVISYNKWTGYFYGWQIDVKTEDIFRCVSKCNEGLVNFNNTCVTECPKSYRYIENGSCQANECATKYMYNTSANVICTDTCDDSYFIFNGTCVTKCPNNVFLTNKTCHIDKCRSKFTVNGSSVVICTDDCLQYGFIDNDVCVEYCPHYVFNDICVQTCPRSHALIANQTRKIKCDYEQKECQKTIKYIECVGKCPEPLYKYKELCLDICPISNYISNRTCVTTCPQSHPYHQQVKVEGTENNLPDGIDKQSLSSTVKYLTMCVEQCSFPQYLLDKTNYSCVDTCPNITRYIYFNVCRSDCPEGKLRNEIKQGQECIDSCPSNKFVFNGTCLQECPENTYNYNNSKCVFECPKSHPFGLTSGRWICIRSCKSYELFKNGSCIFESACKVPYFPFENACVKSCPSGYYWGNACIKRWGKREITILSVTLGLFIFLSILCRRTLMEYFIILSMILFKVDVRCKKNIDDSDEDDGVDENQIEDDHALLIDLNENNEI